ncbi:MAG: ABC transporter permease [candidate division Zixibacteria bacterium]|nr:ABC transporter permease [Candidatus Tariuqbacter arcticus]
MNPKQVIIVYAKEIIDILRDRRTLISMILVPILLFPLLIGGMSSLMGSQVEKIKQREYSIAIIGGENAPGLLASLKENAQFQIYDFIDDLDLAREWLNDNTIMAAVNIPEGFKERLGLFFAGEGEAPALEIIADLSDVESEIASKTLKYLVTEYRRSIVSEELHNRGLRGDMTEPFAIVPVNVASAEKMGGFVAGMILPYLVIILTLMGAMYPAIDLTAGEKERGTMETLLVSPVGRMEMVLGKFLTVITASLATAILAIISLSVTMSCGLMELEEGMSFSISIVSVLSILAMMIPLSMLFSALLMAIAVFARSYREAQTYISPLMIVAILPAMVSYIPGIELTFKLAITPIVNVALILKEMLTDIKNVDPSMIFLTFVSTLVYASAAIWLTFRQFQRESVLFRV